MPTCMRVHFECNQNTRGVNTTRQEGRGRRIGEFGFIINHLLIGLRRFLNKSRGQFSILNIISPRFRGNVESNRIVENLRYFFFFLIFYSSNLIISLIREPWKFINRLKKWEEEEGGGINDSGNYLKIDFLKIK